MRKKLLSVCSFVSLFVSLFVCFYIGLDLEPRCAPKSVGYMFHSRTDNQSSDRSTDVRDPQEEEGEGCNMTHLSDWLRR